MVTQAELRDNLVHRVDVGDSLTRTAARHPDRIAVVDSGRRWRYRDLSGWVHKLPERFADHYGAGA